MEKAKVIEEKDLIKPEFKSEIKAEIKGIAQIEDNIQDVQDYAIELSEYYKNIVFTEDTLKEAKSEKSEVNKFKKKVSDFRKQIVEKYNEPLQKFVDTAKTTETLLTDTYNTINNQVNFYEQELKEQKLEELKTYFEELKTKENIDFVTFEQTNINVTLSASKKSLKESVDNFFKNVISDLKLIDTQEYKDEMLVEYQKELKVERAIAEVIERHKKLDQVKEQQESKKEQEITDEEMINKIDSLTVPKVEEVEIIEANEIVSSTFKVFATIEQIKKLKDYMDKEGIRYE